MVTNLILIILLQTLTSNYRHERELERCCLEPVCLRACQAAERPIFCGLARHIHGERTNAFPAPLRPCPPFTAAREAQITGTLGSPGLRLCGRPRNRRQARGGWQCRRSEAPLPSPPSIQCGHCISATPSTGCGAEGDSPVGGTDHHPTPSSTPAPLDPFLSCRARGGGRRRFSVPLLLAKSRPVTRAVGPPPSAVPPPPTHSRSRPTRRHPRSVAALSCAFFGVLCSLTFSPLASRALRHTSTFSPAAAAAGGAVHFPRPLPRSL